MPSQSRFTSELWELDTAHELYDFQALVTGTITTLAADAGAAAAVTAGGKGGLLGMTTGATLNNEVGAWTANATYVLTADRPLSFRALLALTQGGANSANVFVGFASAPAADLMGDGGAGPRATGTLVGIYKNATDTAWRAIAQNGASRSLALS